jgi:ethanolamine-phosphate phospho-lyase
VVCRREIAESFASSGIEYFNTFSGNSVACAIGEAVLDTLAEEDLQNNALVVGDYLQTRLQALSESYPCIGEVRGVGLFQGIEFVYPPSHPAEAPRPHSALAKFLVDALMERRIIVSQDGPDENVIKLKPPLVFSRENVDTLVGELDSGLQRAKDLRLY